VKPEHGRHPHPDDEQQIVIAAGHDAVDDHRRQHRQRQRHDPQRDRGDEDAPDQRALREELDEVAPDLAAARRRRRERLRRLEREGDTREVLAEAIDRDRAPAECRVDDLDDVAANAIEHDEVVEVPMQDRAGRQVAQIVEAEPHAATAEPELFRAAEDAERIGATPDARGGARVIERDRVAVIGHDHGETRRAAIRGFELLDIGHASGPPAAEPAQRLHRRLRDRILVHSDNRLVPGSSANTIGSARTRTRA
jgi:hypothetical protein